MQSSVSTEWGKYSGAGNDFVLIDDRRGIFSGDVSATCLVMDVDGLILVQCSSRADYRMRIYNRDGGVAEMCGNGLRCVGRFLADLDLGMAFAVETDSGILEVRVGAHVTAQLPSPTGTFPLMDTGVPHYLTRVDAIDSAPVLTVGPKLRAKHNANATFFAVVGDRVFSRTYERGVEGETLACGTGAAAAALASGLPGPIEVVMRSGESLWIDGRDGLWMSGPAVRVFCDDLLPCCGYGH